VNEGPHDACGLEQCRNVQSFGSVGHGRSPSASRSVDATAMIEVKAARSSFDTSKDPDAACNAFDACGVLNGPFHHGRRTSTRTDVEGCLFAGVWSNQRFMMRPGRGPSLSGGLGLAGQELGHANVGSTLHLLRLERSVLDIFNVPGEITSATP
jgi:hypothetical protein